MRAFRTKPFNRFAASNGIDDDELCDAVRRARRGLVDADLGGGVIKQRLARPGQGRAGGFRCIILFRRTGNAFFVHGYAKRDRAGIGPEELRAFRLLASHMLGLDDRAIRAAMTNETITEFTCNAEDPS